MTTTTQRATPQGLAAQLDALDRRIAQQQTTKERMALAAVEYPATAAALAKLMSEINRLKADRTVLQDALTAARYRASTEADAHAVAQRADARVHAARHAAEVIGHATRVDHVLGELKRAMADLQATEDATRAAARIAGDILMPARLGQQGACAHALGILQRVASGSDRMSPLRTTADFCRTG